MNDHANEITITLTVTGNFGGGDTTREVKVTAENKDEVQILLDKATEFIRQEAGNSY